MPNSFQRAIPAERTNMKPKYLAPFAGALIALAIPALAAQGDRYTGTPRYDRLGPTDAIHSGGASPADSELAQRIADELRSDRSLGGTTVTIAVSHGDVMLSGSPKDMTHAARIEQVARNVAGSRRVTGLLDVQGG